MVDSFSCSCWRPALSRASTSVLESWSWRSGAMWTRGNSKTAVARVFAWLASTSGMAWTSIAIPWWGATSGSNFSSRVNTSPKPAISGHPHGKAPQAGHPKWVEPRHKKDLLPQRPSDVIRTSSQRSSRSRVQNRLFILSPWWRFVKHARGGQPILSHQVDWLFPPFSWSALRIAAVDKFF